MIVGIFHQGSGLGNQLHRYVATRVRALDLGVDWRMLYKFDGSGKEAGFKGSSFINIDSKKILYEYNIDAGSIWNEKKVVENGVDIRSYDPEFAFVKDKTIIDGEFQDERYWEHREEEVNEWLKVEPLEMPDDLCVIGFRGGEFALYPDLYLTSDYWADAIRMMRDIKSNMRFQIHTDDIEAAGKMFPDFKEKDGQIVHDIGINWRSMRYAHYAIIANSSFFILPRWLRQGKDDGAVTVCPRFWGRRNVKIWSMNQNYYKRFVHI